MLSHVISQCLVTDRISIKLQLTGKSRLIFQFYVSLYLSKITNNQWVEALKSTFGGKYHNKKT